MRRIYGLHIALAAVLCAAILASCAPAAATATPTAAAATVATVPSSTPGATATASQPPTATPGATAAATGATASAAPLATTDTLGFLPDPKAWQASLHLDTKDYPRVDGSTATLPLGVYMRSKVTGETLEQSDSFTRFTKTSNAWSALANKQTDLLVVYEAPAQTKAALESSGVKLLSAPIGMDALVFLSNKGNPVHNLSKQQIVDIYSGKIIKWSEVGGADTEIVAYQRPDDSGSQALMKKLVMANATMASVPSVQKPAEMGELLDAVAQYANTDNALGYSVYYYVKNMYQVSGIQLMSVDGVEPTDETIGRQLYPYTNAFYAVIREDEPADSPARKLYDWITGAQGHRAIADAGYSVLLK